MRGPRVPGLSLNFCSLRARLSLPCHPHPAGLAVELLEAGRRHKLANWGMRQRSWFGKEWTSCRRSGDRHIPGNSEQLTFPSPAPSVLTTVPCRGGAEAGVSLDPAASAGTVGSHSRRWAGGPWGQFPTLSRGESEVLEMGMACLCHTGGYAGPGSQALCPSASGCPPSAGEVTF